MCKDPVQITHNTLNVPASCLGIVITNTCKESLPFIMKPLWLLVCATYSFTSNPTLGITILPFMGLNVETTNALWVPEGRASENAPKHPLTMSYDTRNGKYHAFYVDLMSEPRAVS